MGTSSKIPPLSSSPSSPSSVLLPRLVLGSILFACIFLSPQLQPLLDRIYGYLYHRSSFYHFSAFETVESIFCYIFIEVFFTRKFGKSPELRIDIRGAGAKSQVVTTDRATCIEARMNVNDRVTSSEGQEKREKPKLPKMKRPSKRMGEMFVYLVPFLLMDLTMIKKFAGVPLAEIVASGGYQPLRLETYVDDDGAALSTVQDGDHLVAFNSNETETITDSSTKISPSFLLPSLHNFTLSSPVQVSRALPPPHIFRPTFRLLAVQLLSSLVIYDFCFFLFHLTLHRPPVLKRLISSLHSAHHSHAEMHPQVTNRLSISERLWLILLANFSLNVIGAHVLTRTIFVPVFVWLLVSIHSGLELEWGYEKILPPGWGTGSRVHARHHRYGGEGRGEGGGLAPFFSWCDAGLGVWDRWSGRARGARKVTSSADDKRM